MYNSNKGKDDSDSKGCLILASIPFGLVALKLLFGLIIGENVYEMETITESGPSNDIQHLRFTFGLMVLALLIYGYNKWYKKK